jgi:hypothetical protein
MATERDIMGWFQVLQGAASEHVGKDKEMSKYQREQLEMLVNISLRIGASVVTDLNRLAEALEHLAACAQEVSK